MLTIKAEVLKKDLRVDGTYNVKISFSTQSFNVKIWNYRKVKNTR